MRTIEQIDKEIAQASEIREQFAKQAREEEDKDYKAGLYINVDNCNNRIDMLLEEKRRLQWKDRS
jgi:hypothetical protein